MLWTNVCAVAPAGAVLRRPAARRATIRPGSTSPRCSIRSASRALAYVTKYWTTSERNTLLPSLTGVLLANRLLWTALAGVVFALGLPALPLRDALRRARRPARRCRPAPAKPVKPDARPEGRAAPPGRARRARREQPGRRARDAGRGGAQGTPRAARHPARHARPRRGAQLWELAKVDMAFVFRSPAYYVLIAIGLLLAGAQRCASAARSWAARRTRSRA